MEKKINGIFNISSDGSILKSDFAIELANSIGFKSFKYKLISSKDIGSLAKRSKDMTLDNNKAKSHFKTIFPTLEETIKLVVKDYPNLN